MKMKMNQKMMLFHSNSRMFLIMLGIKNAHGVQYSCKFPIIMELVQEVMLCIFFRALSSLALACIFALFSAVHSCLVQVGIVAFKLGFNISTHCFLMLVCIAHENNM